MSKVIDLGGILEKSWKLFKDNIGFSIGVGALFFILTMFLNIATEVIKFFLGLEGQTFPETVDLTLLVITLLSALILAILQLGVLKTFLNLVDGGRPDYNHLWDTARFLPAYIGAVLLMAVPLIIGLLLFILPGVYLYVRWQFFAVIIIDQGLGPVAALKKSWHLTRNHILDGFLLLILLAAFTLAGALFFGVGLIFTLPLTMLTLSLFYRSLGARV